MGGQVVGVEDILTELKDLESHYASGDCGVVEYSTIIKVTRMRLALASATFGAESQQTKAVLQDLAFTMYMASRFDKRDNLWAESLKAYEMCGMGDCEYAMEARMQLIP
jgi:hypothetical protein